MTSTLLLAALLAPAAEPAAYKSHPPIRPLPTASARPADADATRLLYADPKAGDDANDGSREKPWKTLARAVRDLKPGDVLYLKGGTYYEHVTVNAIGTTDKPITIRSFPGELAILDGGLREFFDSPETAWEPSPGGAVGEFQSVKAYPALSGQVNGTNVLGHFGDSMVPLQGYRFLGDLRSDNVYWNITQKVGDAGFIYCGPGVYHDPATGKIHVRLAHTKMKYLPASDNYVGETDPRKLPLVIAGSKDEAPLALTGAKFVRVQDVVVRGSRGPTVTVHGCENVEFDGLTVYAGSSAFQIKESGGVRLAHTACRGIAAPWTFRGSLKYRAIEARIVSAAGWTPTPIPNRDLEFAYCEFTDSVDGVFIGGVQGVRFHHNLLDNVTDDGVFLTSGTGYDGVTPGGDVHIYQNLFSRCLTTFAFGVGHGRQKAISGGVQTGSGVFITRNVFDFRAPIRYFQPRSADDPPELPSRGRFASDHGSPAWEPMTIYHNTLLCADDRGGTYGAWGFGNGITRGTKRRAFNNIVVQMALPAQTVYPPVNVDFQADGNLLWSAGKIDMGDPFAQFRTSKAFEESKLKYPPGWGATDRFADPRFVAFSPDSTRPLDLRPNADSPAIDNGVSLPAEWPDPLRDADKGKPDIGVLPTGGVGWHVGVGGRLDLFGAEKPMATRPTVPAMKVTPPFPVPTWAGKPAALVEGYPILSAPLFEYAFRKQGVPIERFDKRWLDPKEYGKYSVVVVAGSLSRAKVMPDHYSVAALKQVDEYLKGGGTLMLVLAGKAVFGTPDGGAYLNGITATTPAKKTLPEFAVLEIDHPWVKHLDPAGAYAWKRASFPGEWVLRAGKGDRLIGSPDGSSILYRVRVGKGQLIYVGWDLHEALPYTRGKDSTPAAEKAFEDQMGILFRMAADLFPNMP